MSATEVVVAVVAGVLVLWLILLVVLLRARPAGVDAPALVAALRLLPDVDRLLRRLAADPASPRRVRVLLVVLVGYLALPVDLVPDVIPVLGQADDVLVAVLVLRAVVRAAGVDAVHRHWPGTPDGLAAVLRLTGLPDAV